MRITQKCDRRNAESFEGVGVHVLERQRTVVDHPESLSANLIEGGPHASDGRDDGIVNHHAQSE